MKLSDMLENRHGIYGVWGWRGIVAYVVGFVASIPFWNLSFYESSFAKSHSGLDISFIVELVVAGVVYAVLARTISLVGYEEVVHASNERLVDLGIRDPEGAVAPVKEAVEASV